MALEPGSLDDVSVQEVFCGLWSLLGGEHFQNEIHFRTAETFVSNSPHVH